MKINFETYNVSIHFLMQIHLFELSSIHVKKNPRYLLKKKLCSLGTLMLKTFHKLRMFLNIFLGNDQQMRKSRMHPSTRIQVKICQRLKG